MEDGQNGVEGEDVHIHDTSLAFKSSARMGNCLTEGKGKRCQASPSPALCCLRRVCSDG